MNPRQPMHAHACKQSHLIMPAYILDEASSTQSAEFPSTPFTVRQLVHALTMASTAPRATSVVVLSRTKCTYCEKLKSTIQDMILNQVNVNVITVSTIIQDEDDRAAFLAEVAEATQTAHRTFPMVWINGAFCGGYTEAEKQLGFCV